MKNNSLKKLMAIIFVIILFAGISVISIAAGENMTAEEIFEYIMSECVKQDFGYYGGTLNASEYNSPLIVIDAKKLAGYDIEFSSESILINGSDGKKTFNLYAGFNDRNFSGVRAEGKITTQLYNGVDLYTPNEEQVIYVFPNMGNEVTGTDNISWKYCNVTDGNDIKDIKNTSSNNSNNNSDVNNNDNNQEVNSNEKEVYKIPQKADLVITKDMVDEQGRFYFTSEQTGAYSIVTSINGITNYHDIYLPNGAVANGSAIDSNGDFDSSNREIYSDKTYYMIFTEEELENGIKMTAEKVGNANGTMLDATNSSGAQPTNETAFEKIEKIMPGFVMNLAKVLNWCVARAFDRTLTIDNIVFIDKQGEGNLEDVRLSFFSGGIDEDAVTAKSSMVDALRPAVNEWYGIFRGIAIIGYLIILVYIGIKVLLTSTSANKKASYKETLVTWIIGIVILFFMPFYMKYTILLNEALVIKISDSRSNDAKEGAISTSAVINDSTTYTTAVFEPEEGEEGVINFEGKDYMSKVGKLAEETESLGISLAYLIMTWQLIMMIVYYYKRVFITAFLIIIFPLIALTYVWDKLNDGKSQALSAWIHEYTIGVFIQSFHAIIFVFVTNTIYATLTDQSADFILLMIASSFMFSGEEILKQIFNGGGPPPQAYGSVAQTAAKIAVIGGMATNIAKRTITNIAGREGFVRSTARSMQNAYRNGLIRKNFEQLATDPRENRVNALLPTDRIIPAAPGSDVRTAADTVERLNNMDKNSASDIGKAINDYKDLKSRLNSMDPETRKAVESILSKSQFSDAQIDILDKGMVNAAIMASNGVSKNIIMQKLKFEVDIAFPSGTASDKNMVSNKIFRAALTNMSIYGASSAYTREHLESKWNEKISEMRDLNNNMKFVSDSDDVDEKAVRERIASKAKRIEKQLSKSIKGYDSLSDDNSKKRKLQRFATAVASVSEANSGIYNGAKGSGGLQELKNYRNELEEILKDDELASDKDAINAVLSSNVRLSMVDSVIANNGKGNRKESIIDNRSNGLMEQYFKAQGGKIVEEIDESTGAAVQYVEINGTKLAKEQVEYIEECSKDISIIEQLDTEAFSEYDAYRAVTDLERKIRDEKSQEAQALLRISSIESDIDTLKYILAKKIATGDTGVDRSGVLGSNKQYMEALDWAKREVRNMEQKAFDDAINTNPVVLIYDILAAANGKGSKSRKDIASVDSLLDSASDINDGASSILDEKHLSLRAQNQKERLAAQKFAREALAELGDEKLPKEESTYNGYTYDEIKELEKLEMQNARANAVGILSDVLIGAPASVIGAAANMAYTDDGIPFGEAASGVVGGLAVSNFATDNITTKLAGKDAAKKISSIESKVEKRLKANNKDEKLKARQAFADAEYKARGKADSYLEIKLVTANIYISAHDELCATVFIQAENAEYVSVSEVPSFVWQPYSEQVEYIFKDNDINKLHDLYIYVKDNSGNIKRSVLSDIKYEKN